MIQASTSKQMNILLWALQVLLALWSITGGLYMINNYNELAKKWALDALPGPFWMILGAVQVLFALGLVLPGLFRILPGLVLVAAVVLAVVSIAGVTLYTAYSGFPGMLWGLLPAVIALFIAYGRWPANP